MSTIILYGTYEIDICKQMDLLQHHWNDQSYQNKIFDQIYQWEKELIIKIQLTANTVRVNLTREHHQLSNPF